MWGVLILCCLLYPVSILMLYISLVPQYNELLFRCGPCRLSTPVVKEILKDFSGAIDVVELCTDDLAEIASDCGVISIPTIQLYYRGRLMETIVGCVAKGVLANAVDKVLEDIIVREKRKA
jgi:thioredoxin 1